MARRKFASPHTGGLVCSFDNVVVQRRVVKFRLIRCTLYRKGPPPCGLFSRLRLLTSGSRPNWRGLGIAACLVLNFFVAPFGNFAH